jgi:glycyl-tRNA synthetase beta chain
MSYQLQDGWSSVNFVRPAHAWSPCTAPMSCRFRARPDPATPPGPPLRGAVDPVVIADADSYAETLRATAP